ncbi:MAG: anaerobic ribonucleoside-triphosphate reductase activating protein [archaeon]|nr:anaerobic ribonucleoside-triphosphate reductase activating protein [archaeon]
MYFGAVKDIDIADGPGVRVSLFVSGCTHCCKGCFQPETWDFSYGEPFCEDTEERIIDLLSRPYIAGLTVLGGEPFEPSNQEVLAPFLEKVRGRLPGKNIWCYSGYTWEELVSDSRARCAFTDRMLATIDVLVDGEFKEDLRNLTLRFRGSSNQRLIDVRPSLETGSVVLWEGS